MQLWTGRVFKSEGCGKSSEVNCRSRSACGVSQKGRLWIIPPWKGKKKYNNVYKIIIQYLVRCWRCGMVLGGVRWIVRVRRLPPPFLDNMGPAFPVGLGNVERLSCACLEAFRRVCGLGGLWGGHNSFTFEFRTFYSGHVLKQLGQVIATEEVSTARDIRLVLIIV